MFLGFGVGTALKHFKTQINGKSQDLYDGLFFKTLLENNDVYGKIFFPLLLT
jgi:hypothetical protein